MKFSLLLFFFTTVSTLIKAEEADTLVYISGQSLTWDDFWGKPDPNDTITAALISTTIQMKMTHVDIWMGIATFEVYAIMYKRRSWVSDCCRDKFVLSHEQLHFDIAELFARKLQRELNSLKLSPSSKAQASMIFKKWRAILHMRQSIYDLETHGEYDNANQKMWEERIRNKLQHTTR